MSVSYARALLFLQAACWGLMCGVAIVWALTTQSAPPGGIPVWHHPVWAFAAAAVAAALTGAKALLATRISHRSLKTRQTVVIVEYLMVGFAVMLSLATFNLNGGTIPFFASFVGGIMSLVAAILLNRPEATQYFVKSSVDRASPKSGSHDDRGQQRLIPPPAGCWSYL